MVCLMARYAWVALSERLHDGSSLWLWGLKDWTSLAGLPVLS
jgi:hypothetical protein